MSKFNISSKKVSELVEKYEVKTNERKLKNFFKTFAFYALVLMSVYHFYASGLMHKNDKLTLKLMHRMQKF